MLNAGKQVLRGILAFFTALILGAVAWVLCFFIMNSADWFVDDTRIVIANVFAGLGALAALYFTWRYPGKIWGGIFELVASFR